MAVLAAPTTPATSSRADRPGELGFALYELLLALAILGLVSGVVFPRVIRPPGPSELRGKAQEIAALLRSDRNIALRQGREVLSRVDLGDSRVVSGAGPHAVSIPSDIRTELVQSSREARADEGGIRFRPDGRSSGGVLVLRRGDAAYEVSVNWLTSSVLVSAASSGAGR
jgi:general secretion pathway protein H